MSDPQRSAEAHSAQASDPQPLVTIVVPAYNRAGGLLEETLDSILAQDYPNLEVLVLDDGSTDETPQVLERYAAAHPERLRWERHQNMGQPKTLNRGFEMARGELIGYLNSDDLFLPGAITKLVAMLVADPEAALAYPAYRIIKGEEAEEMADMVPPEYTVAEAVRLHNCIVNVGAIFRRRVVERIGGWDPNFTYLADFDWCVRANSVGHFLRHPEVLACWRNHPGSANYAPGLEAAREQTRLLDKIYSADDLSEDVLAVRDEAYRNAFIVAAFAMGGVNRADGRFFIHDTLAREVSSRMPETDAEMNARMRQRMTNLERREKSLVKMVARLQAGERPGGPRWRSALRRVTPPALRPAGRRVLGKVTRDGQPPIPKIEQQQTK
jgi:glycosyltransferase involved in cell wall biosynthesis